MNLKKIIKEEVNHYVLENNGDDTLTVYHGTNNKFVNDIKTNGLIDKQNHYSQGWYVVSTDIESALFHATPQNKEDVTVFEFEIPLIDNHYWEGYPYLWNGEKRNDKSTWYALKQPLPPNLIKNIHRIPYQDWVQRKQDKY